MVKTKFIPFWILFTTVPISLQSNYIGTICKEFNFQSPHLIGPINEFPIDIIKSLYKDGNFAVIDSQVKDVKFKENVVTNTIFFPTSNFNDTKKILDVPKNTYSSLMLISKNKEIEELLNVVAAKTNIDQKVFIYSNDTGNLFEAYSINNFVVKKKLGYLDLVSNNFKWSVNVNPDFIKRRSDFGGTVLKGMVEFAGTELNADSTYLEKAPYFPNNQTYRIDNFTYGLFNDIMQILQDRLNFTTMLYKRKEVSWGYIRPTQNGSFEGTGIVGDIFFKRADIALASLHIKIERALYIDYLPPVSMFF